MKLTKEDLDNFVKAVDDSGGPLSSRVVERLWRDFQYQPTYIVDQSLDPYSQAYVDAQLELYKEISGLEDFDQYKNEITEFPLETLVNSANPFPEPLQGISNITKHVTGVTSALGLANLPLNASVLDMGSGWGLTSEMITYCGGKVTAVDINPKFTELVSRRNDRFKSTIIPVNSSFDDFESDERFDAVFFYECLHHSLKTWEVIEKYKNLLKDTGALIISAEPVNEFWWKHWGLRLDAMSIYCIRKHGWFESGWSHDFLMEMLNNSGLRVEHHVGAGSFGTDVYISRKFG